MLRSPRISVNTSFSAGRSISEGSRCLVAVKLVTVEGKRDAGHCTADPDISIQLVYGFKSIFLTDFCLESSLISYMALKGLRLLLPYIATLLLVIVLPQDFLQEGIQRALPTFLFYFPFLFAFNTQIYIFLHPLPRFLLFVLPPAFFCCDKPADACSEQRQQPRCARHLGRADPAACRSLQNQSECGRWTTATPPSPPGFPLSSRRVAVLLPSQQRLLHPLSVRPAEESAKIITWLKPFSWRALSWWIYSFTPFLCSLWSQRESQENMVHVEAFTNNSPHFQPFCY